MIVGSTPATTQLCNGKTKGLTVCTSVMDYFSRVILKQFVLKYSPFGVSFWSDIATCFAALVPKYSHFVWRDSSGSTYLTIGRQMAGLVEFNHDEQPPGELSKSSRFSVRLFRRLFSVAVFLSLRPNSTPPHPNSSRLQAG